MFLPIDTFFPCWLSGSIAVKSGHSFHPLCTGCLILCSETVKVSIKIINSPALYVHYLFSNVALGLIQAKGVKLEYMSHCLYHWFSTGCYSPHPHPSGNIWQCLETFSVVTAEEEGCSYLVDRDQGCCAIPCNTLSSATTQSYIQPKMSVCSFRETLA